MSVFCKNMWLETVSRVDSISKLLISCLLTHCYCTLFAKGSQKLTKYQIGLYKAIDCCLLLRKQTQHWFAECNFWNWYVDRATSPGHNQCMIIIRIQVGILFKLCVSNKLSPQKQTSYLSRTPRLQQGMEFQTKCESVKRIDTAVSCHSSYKWQLEEIRVKQIDWIKNTLFNWLMKVVPHKLMNIGEWLGSGKPIRKGKHPF